MSIFKTTKGEKERCQNETMLQCMHITQRDRWFAQPPVQWVMGLFSPQQRGRDVKLRIGGTTPLIPCISLLDIVFN